MVHKRSEGWLFKKGKRRARLSDFDKMFVHNARRVHSLYQSLFSHFLSTWRKMHRGTVLETMGRVDEVVVTLMNRWRTKEGTRGTTPGLTM